MTTILMTLLYTLIFTAIFLAVLYFTKPWWQGQRTRIVGALLTFAGYIQTADLSWLPDGIAGPVMFGAGIVVIVLRQWTNTPAGIKEDA